MKKVAMMLLAAGMLASVNTFAHDGGKQKKCRKETTCAGADRSCCKKPARATLLKAKPKVEVKKEA